MFTLHCPSVPEVTFSTMSANVDETTLPPTDFPELKHFKTSDYRLIIKNETKINIYSTKGV